VSTLHVDAYGHVGTPPDENTLAAAAVSTTAAGTIAGTTSAGAAPTVTAVNASDNAGTFTLTPVTGGGAQAAGETVKVFFAQSYRKAPKAVQVTVVNINTASTPAAVASYATSITSAGFAVTTIALTTAQPYLVVYHVIL
jgi:hypothetical protein